ncbi:MAG: Isopentenyl-diphosphate Delta-isomerase [Candidatus Ordinivivax streblomastigis]|uniref:Isopentenyl-diphosphate delta-isomerase n=1 Tax=Candidatus Ordinivivax streblomastigis TaxID=2540710 RepID=A0A5M8P0W5_9BACT|nr:MAG: Isopentenyl-diphosphate Delta-isomerase [Candidatus Ordinivivax streblomastigis]
MDLITLIDDNDNVIGFDEKLKVHIEGKLHRAFSIFITNHNHEILLQKRNLQKYHSGGLWSNSCCGHPNYDETIERASHKRLIEEFGFECSLSYLYKFRYKTSFANSLIENEIDYVFWGCCDKIPNPNPQEISDWRWVNISDLGNIIGTDCFTYWFQKSYKQFVEYYKII